MKLSAVTWSAKTRVTIEGNLGFAIAAVVELRAVARKNCASWMLREPLMRKLRIGTAAGESASVNGWLAGHGGEDGDLHFLTTDEHR